MLNWGDKDAAEQLAGQMRDLLKDRTMTFDQLASVYSIRQGQSVLQRLKEMSRNGRPPMSIGDFVAQMEDFFELVGRNEVRARAEALRGGGRAAVVPQGLAAAEAARGAPGYRTAAVAGRPTAADGRGTAGVQSWAAAAAAVSTEAGPEGGAAPMKYADVSKAVQNILKERVGPVSVAGLDAAFKTRHGTSIADIVGMSTEEYLERKENIFSFDEERGTVCLKTAMNSGPPLPQPDIVKDEAFVVREFEQLIESLGPVVYISTLCGKFIQRNGVSVTSVIAARPLDVFKRHPGVFLMVGAGNVTLKKYEHCPEVCRLTGKPSSKAHRIVKASEEAQLPVPQVITEQHVVEEFRRLILTDGLDSVYISSLCGRFLQRFKKPVTNIITCKPADFLRRYPDVFVMTGGGNVGLREVLGPDAVSVPPPPPRIPKAVREEQKLNLDVVKKIELDDQAFDEIHTSINKDTNVQAVVQRLKQVCKQIEQASFLALDDVVLGGAAGQGLISNNPTAEIVCFVRRLPYKNFPQWLPHILDTLGPVLEANLVSLRADRFKVEKDHLRFMLASDNVGSTSEGSVTGELRVKVYISPVFRDSNHVLEVFKVCPASDRQYLYPALVRERNAFIARQPARRKVLMRLIMWWASKQTWSTNAAAPSDWLLQVTCIHACRQWWREFGGQDPTSFVGLASAVSHAFEVLAKLDTAKVVLDKGDAGACYLTADVPRSISDSDRFVVDPLNQHCNLIDPSSAFDWRELTTAAGPGCLLALQKEAARWLLLSEEDHLADDAERDEHEDDHEESIDDDEEFEDAEDGLD